MANWHCHFAVVSALVVCNLVLTSAGPVEDFIAKLPGQPDVNFKQYGGYVTVDNKSGRALYYYFVEVVNDTASTPISLWLNGGPGCSSIGGGAFTELGPFYPEADGHGLRINKNSWNKVSNLLFVESPVGVGWSYSNNSADYIRNDDLTAKDMLTFLVHWFKKFPEYSSRDLFLTGESYAGHYIPQLANNALLYNKMAKESKLNLKGLFIGNPLLRLNVDTPAIYEYLWTHGVISDETKHSLDQNCKFNMEKDGVEISDNSKKCKSISKEIEKQIGKFVDEYNVIIDVCPPALYEQQLRLRKKISHMSLGVDVCMTAERSFYFNTPEVQKALHANVTSLPYRWTMCSNFLNYSSIDGGINILPILKNIIQHDIRVWIFSGDQDSVVPLLGSRTNVRNLADDLRAPVKLPYRPWYHEGQVGGWTTVYGDFLTFATVRGASHMVPFSQPVRALKLFTSFVFGKDLPNIE